MGVSAQGAPALYNPGTPPSNPNDPVYLQNELKKLRMALAALEERGPKAANQAPIKPQVGWIRYAQSPWNPLGTGNGPVMWNGTAWISL